LVDVKPPKLVDDFAGAGAALGATAVVTVLSAIGIQGDLLPRLVRNEPTKAAVLVSVAVVAVLLLLFKSLELRLLGVCALAVALVLIIVQGVQSLSDRENPGLTLATSSTPSTSPTTAGTLTITVSATATSLRNQETMLVQLIAFPTAVGPSELADECTTTRRLDDPEKDGLVVLLWEESGPDQAGKTTADSTVDIPSDAYAQVCALVRLRDRDTGVTGDDRYTWGYRTTRPELTAGPA
jgi:hypothetical protein